MGWWQNLWIERAKDWTYASLSPEQTPDKHLKILLPNDEYYLNIFLRSVRISNLRQGLAKFYGTVHSYISLPSLSGTGQFQTVVSPEALCDQDSTALDNVIMINHRLLGPIPYRGGDVRMEVGLFSVQSSELARPFLSLLECLARGAGVAFTSSAKPFVEPLLKGINMLVCAQGGLEIGLARTYDKVFTGNVVVIRAQRGTIDVDSLRLDADYRLSDRSGRLVGNHPYVVLGFEASRRRDDWFEIPELKDAYDLLKGEIRRDKLPAIREAWASFKRIARTCPDLIQQDTERLITGKLQPLVDSVLMPTPTSAGRVQFPELAGLDLYDDSVVTQ